MALTVFTNLVGGGLMIETKGLQQFIGGDDMIPLPPKDGEEAPLVFASEAMDSIPGPSAPNIIPGGGSDPYAGMGKF